MQPTCMNHKCFKIYFPNQWWTTLHWWQVFVSGDNGNDLCYQLFKKSVPTPVGQVPKWAFLWLTRNAYLCLWHVRTSSLLPSKCFLSHGCMALTICIECTIHISGRGCWAVFMPPLWKDKYNLSDHQIVIWISETQPKLLQILRRQCCQKHTAILSISCVCWKAVIDLHMWTYLHPHQSSENSWSDLFTPAHPIAGEFFKDMVLLDSSTCKDSRLSCLQNADGWFEWVAY